MGKRTFVHKDSTGPQGGSWLAEDDESSTDTLYANWMKKFMRQSLVEYLDKAPQTTSYKTCRFTFFMENGEKSTAQLAWGTDQSGKQRYYGQSDFSGDWVRLEPSTASSVIADIPSVLGGSEDPGPTSK